MDESNAVQTTNLLLVVGTEDDIDGQHHYAGATCFAVTWVPSRSSSVPRTAIWSPASRLPKTSTRLPITAPRLTSTHSTLPTLMRITKVRSVVTAMAEGGTKREGRGLVTGHRTSVYIPGDSFAGLLATSSSIGIVLVLVSSAWAGRRTFPEN